MRKFKLFINGTNFLMNVEDQPLKMGFYTTRYLEAADEAMAEEAVIEMLKEDAHLVEATLNDLDDSPMLFVLEITEMESLEGCPVPGTGFTFYSEDEEDS